MKPHTHDVIVVGAGPAGCHLAAETAGSGLDVVVVDRANGGNKAPVCTGIIGEEALRRFRLPREAVITEIKDIRCFAPSGDSIVFRPSQSQACVLDRSSFDESLRARARAEGALVRTGVICSSLSAGPSGVVVETNRGPIRGRLLALASGYSPGLTSLLGLGTPSSHFQGVQCEVEISDLEETEVHVGNGVAPASFAWAVGIGHGKARIGLTARRNASLLLERFMASPALRGRVRSQGPVRRRLIPFGALNRTFAERVIAVGDAAGQVKTTTHGGIYYGLISAHHGAATIKEAFRDGDLSAERLGSYEGRWRKELDIEITHGILLRSLFSRLSDRQINALFRIAQKDGIMALVHRKARFDWHEELISSLMQHALFLRFFVKRGRGEPAGA